MAVQSSSTYCSVKASRRFLEGESLYCIFILNFINIFTLGNISRSLQEVVRKLDTEFSNITKILLIILDNMKISVKHIKYHISLPPGYISVCISPLWDEIEKTIDVNRDTMKDLFKALHMHLWNFLDYYLLENLINGYGNKDLKTRMQKYADKIENFKQNTLLVQFFEHKCWRMYNRDIPEYLNMDIKFNREDLTLAQLDTFRKELTCKYLPFPIDYTSWIFYRDFKRCIQVSWFIPELLSPSLRKNVKALRTLFKEYGVCLVKLEEDNFYSVDYEQGELSKFITKFIYLDVRFYILTINHS